jgi:hypothetical protein
MADRQGMWQLGIGDRQIAVPLWIDDCPIEDCLIA